MRVISVDIIKMIHVLQEAANRGLGTVSVEYTGDYKEVKIFLYHDLARDVIEKCSVSPA